MSEVKRHKYNWIVGIKDNDVVILDDVFEYSSGFHGATGSGMRLYTPTEIQSMLDEDICAYYKELWKEAVACDATEDSLEEWSERVWEEEKQEYNAVFPGDWDHSGVDDFQKALNTLERERPEDFKRFWNWWMEQLDVDTEDSDLMEDMLETYHYDRTNDNNCDSWETLGVFRWSHGGRCLSNHDEFDIVLDPEALKIAQEAEKDNEGN